VRAARAAQAEKWSGGDLPTFQPLRETSFDFDEKIYSIEVIRAVNTFFQISLAVPPPAFMVR
jgi:hypothetical protein